MHGISQYITVLIHWSARYFLHGLFQRGLVQIWNQHPKFKLNKFSKFAQEKKTLVIGGSISYLVEV